MDQSPERILVTGAGGFVGSRVAEELLRRGGRKVVLQGRSRALDPALLRAGGAVSMGDLEDAAYARRVCVDVDAIVHCAGLAGTWGPYEAYRRANVVATENLLAAARDAGVRRFVNLSSPSISFAFCDLRDVREDWLPERFSGAYARTKWEAECAVRSAHSRNLTTVSLRPRSVIGRGDANVLPRLIRLREAGALLQVGSGDKVVDVTAVSNLVEIIILCLEAPAEAMGETYNVSNGAPVRFWDFVDFVLREAGFPPAPRRRVPYWAAMAAARANQALHRALRSKREPALLPISVGVLAHDMTLDISKARAKLGYRPRANAEDAVREFIEARKRMPDESFALAKAKLFS